MKIFSPKPLGFLSIAGSLQDKIGHGGTPAEIGAWKAQLLNNRIDAGVTGAFLILVAVVVAANARLWWQLLAGKASAELHEEAYVASTDREVAEV